MMTNGGTCAPVQGQQRGKCPRARPKAMQGVGVGGVIPSCNGVLGYDPGKFSKLYAQNGAFWGKIALRFDSKQSALLTQTFDHKQLSEVA